MLCFDNFVLCFDNFVLCFDNFVLCFDNFVLCFEYFLLCFENFGLCFTNIDLCFKTIVLCFKNCLICLQIWATVVYKRSIFQVEWLIATLIHCISHCSESDSVSSRFFLKRGFNRATVLVHIFNGG